MRIATVLTLLVLCGCGHAGTNGGPLSPFNGDYRIVETADPESGVPEELGALSRLYRLPNRVGRMFAPTLGEVHMTPAIGGEYAEWKIVLDDPAHELRMLVGPRGGDGSFAVFRFEQQPAPRVLPNGTGLLEGNQFVATFTTADPQMPRFGIRERWVLLDDGRLQFSLEAPNGDGFIRVGGFVATRD